MKILEVCPKFHHSVASGSTNVAYYISEELARRGHSVAVYTSDMKDKYTRMNSGVQEIDGIRVHRFRSIGTIATREMKIFVTPAIIQRARNEIRSFDVIHIHDYRGFQGTVIHHFARKYSIPYVLQAHGSLPRIMDKKSLKWLYDLLFGYRLLRDASKVVALSHLEAEQYKGMGVPEGKIEVIPNGINLSEYSHLPPKGSFKKKFGINDYEKIILYLGRIHRIKGIDILVKAFANVIEKLEDVRLVVVGPDDGYLREIEALTKALKIEDKVLISGPLYGNYKLEAYVDADVYVLPSRYETFPVAVLEAVACGTPVLLTENCGIAEYFKDKVGLVVKPDFHHLGEALLKMLIGNDRQNTFRENCKTMTEAFDISKTISKLEEVYRKCVLSN